MLLLQIRTWRQSLFTRYVSYHHKTENTYVASSVYLHALSISRAINLSYVPPAPNHFFHLLRTVIIEVWKFFFLRPISYSIRAFFLLYFFRFAPHSCSIFSFIFLFDFCFVMFSFVEFFRSVFGADFVKPAKYRGLKIDTEVAIYEKQNGRPRATGSAIIYGAGLTDCGAIQHFLHRADLDRGPGSELIFLKEVINHINGFTNSYPFDFHCTSMDEVPETS